jgi:alginate O-acetyltransferase complex protein AlgI
LLFKYVGFFSGVVAHFLGGSGEISRLDVIAPVGISFYILQSLSYVIDVYRRQLRPHSSVPEYALYISFFPQLLAGPIERAGQMLPQMGAPRFLTSAGMRDGAWLCFWGLFEKCVVSDNLQSQLIAPYFRLGTAPNGLATAVVLWASCVRVYCDFDGYSNIARGLARVLGFELSINFRLPFYSVSSKNFWRRFHITFYRWAKDYVFLPLVKNLRVPTILGLFIVFSLSGLWHEFRWTFVCWGLLEACTILVSEIPSRIITPVYASSRGLKKAFLTLGGIASVRFFRMITTAFFLASTVPQALSRLEPLRLISSWKINSDFWGALLIHAFFAFPLVLVEIPQLITKREMFPVQMNLWLRAGLFYILGLYLLLFGAMNAQTFVYFQF